MPLRIIVLPITPEHDLFIKAGQKIEQNVQAALAGPVKREVKLAFHKRTTGWKVRPVMAGMPLVMRDSFGALYVFPRGQGREIWIWLTMGVGAHDIVPKVKSHYSYLKVRLNYSPRTTAAGGFGGKGTYGGPTIKVYGAVRNWPGIAARTFEKYIIQEVEDRVLSILVDAVRRALP